MTFLVQRAVNEWVRASAILAGACVLACLASPARAEMTGDVALDEARSNRPDRQPSLLSARVSIGEINEDTFLTTNFRFNWERALYGFGLQLPLRWRLKDRAPDDKEALGLLRKEDWDHFTDFFRLVRYVRVGQRDKKGLYFASLGELDRVSMGHGTILHRYHNGMDFSRWRVGLNAVANVGIFGGEALVGDVAAPYLTGLRFYARPITWSFRKANTSSVTLDAPEIDDTEPDELDPEVEAPVSGPLEPKKRPAGVVFGTSFIADWTAPLALERDLSSPIERAQMGRRDFAIDDDGLLSVARKTPFAVFGLDAGVEMPFGDHVIITPYMDLNKMTTVASGWGWHLGVMSSLFIPTKKKPIWVHARAEYRRVSGDYIAPYFDTVYEIERFQRLTTSGGGGETKLSYFCVIPACNDSGLSFRNGAFFELQMQIPDIISAGGAYIGYDGGRPDGSFRLAIEVPAFKWFELRAFYYRINIEDTSDWWAIDDRTALVTELRVPLLRYFTVNVRYWSVWQIDEAGGGGYRAIDDWSVGAGLRIKLGGDDEVELDSDSKKI